MSQAGCEPWPFGLHESTLTHRASKPLGKLAIKSTNKLYPFVKNMYYIVCLLDALHLNYSDIDR